MCRCDTTRWAGASAAVRRFWTQYEDSQAWEGFWFVVLASWHWQGCGMHVSESALLSMWLVTCDHVQRSVGCGCS
jgi:hypothetical protein